jgi:hypothetical protein
MAKIKTLIELLHNNKRLPAGRQYDTAKIAMSDDAVHALASVGAIEYVADEPEPKPVAEKPKRNATKK